MNTYEFNEAEQQRIREWYDFIDGTSAEEWAPAPAPVVELEPFIIDYCETHQYSVKDHWLGIVSQICGSASVLDWNETDIFEYGHEEIAPYYYIAESFRLRFEPFASIMQAVQTNGYKWVPFTARYDMDYMHSSVQLLAEREDVSPQQVCQFIDVLLYNFRLYAASTIVQEPERTERFLELLKQHHQAIAVQNPAARAAAGIDWVPVDIPELVRLHLCKLFDHLQNDEPCKMRPLKAETTESQFLHAVESADFSTIYNQNENGTPSANMKFLVHGIYLELKHCNDETANAYAADWQKAAAASIGTTPQTCGKRAEFVAACLRAATMKTREKT